MSRKKFLKNLTSLSVLQVVNYILPLLLIPFLVKKIGINNVGLIAVMTAIAAYFQLVIDYGFNLTATRDIAKFSDDNKKTSSITSAVINIKIMILAIIIIISIPAYYAIDYIKDNFLVYFFSVAMIVARSFFPVWHFQGIQEMKYISISNVIPKVVFALLIFYFVRDEDDVWKVQFLYFAGTFVSLVLGSYFLKIKCNFKYCFQFDQIIFYIKDGFSIFLAKLVSGLYKNYNILALGFFASPTLVGVYSIAEKAIRGIQMLQNVVGDVLYPIFSKKSHQDKDFYKKTAKKYSFIIILVYGFSSLIIFMMSGFLSNLLSNVFNTEVKLAIEIMSLGFLFGGMNYLIAILGLTSNGYSNLYSKCIISTGFFNLIIATCLCYYYSYIGAAISLVLSELFLLLLLFVFAKKIKLL
ncbi:oligosaccharide flippase family protein [Klebsiella sp. BIGb0407]|uniref:oligosaccharide flippase family protein n=1 Tax=Klebsiella sp. BIGb0407 TaxID=2940603 RepID=UPI002168FA81|nr:oligosaccharide flippase family protein [Klebsiella sp. BIGb0407]MCS3430539.1 PST family polysaccharide transporter [Klebsiella sp. BIGb0407]